MTTKLTSIEVELPQDIIFAMRGHRGNRKVEDIIEKLKISLAIILFQEGTISPGKAAELARMSRIKFMIEKIRLSPSFHQGSGSGASTH